MTRVEAVVENNQAAGSPPLGRWSGLFPTADLGATPSRDSQTWAAGQLGRLADTSGTLKELPLYDRPQGSVVTVLPVKTRETSKQQKEMTASLSISVYRRPMSF